MRNFASIVVLVVLGAALTACSCCRPANVCCPPLEPCNPDGTPVVRAMVPPAPPPPSVRACGLWPDCSDPSVPNSPFARWYLQQLIDDPDHRAWSDVVAAAMQCRDSLPPGHPHTSATCSTLWQHVKRAYEAYKLGDRPTCITELSHPDHAN
jgi:hypothetical protein